MNLWRAVGIIMSIYCTMNIENNLRCPCILIYEANVERFQKRWGTPFPPPSPHVLLSISYESCNCFQWTHKKTSLTEVSHFNKEHKKNMAYAYRWKSRSRKKRKPCRYEPMSDSLAHVPIINRPILKLFTLPPKKVYDKKSDCSAITMVPPRNQISQYTSLKVTHNPCSLHLVSFFLNSSKHEKSFIRNSPSVW